MNTKRRLEQVGYHFLPTKTRGPMCRINKIWRDLGKVKSRDCWCTVILHFKNSGYQSVFCIPLTVFRILYFISGAREPEAEEPLLVARSILFEFEVDQVAEPKALRPDDLQMLVARYGSCLKAAVAIRTSEAFVRQNKSKTKNRSQKSRVSSES